MACISADKLWSNWSFNAADILWNMHVSYTAADRLKQCFLHCSRQTLKQYVLHRNLQTLKQCVLHCSRQALKQYVSHYSLEALKQCVLYCSPQTLKQCVLHCSLHTLKQYVLYCSLQTLKQCVLHCSLQTLKQYVLHCSLHTLKQYVLYCSLQTLKQCVLYCSLQTLKQCVLHCSLQTLKQCVLYCSLQTLKQCVLHCNLQTLKQCVLHCSWQTLKQCVLPFSQRFLKQCFLHFDLCHFWIVSVKLPAGLQPYLYYTALRSPVGFFAISESKRLCAGPDDGAEMSRSVFRDILEADKNNVPTGIGVETCIYASVPLEAWAPPPSSLPLACRLPATSSTKCSFRVEPHRLLVLLPVSLLWLSPVSMLLLAAARDSFQLQRGAASNSTDTLGRRGKVARSGRAWICASADLWRLPLPGGTWRVLKVGGSLVTGSGKIWGRGGGSEDI